MAVSATLLALSAMPAAAAPGTATSKAIILRPLSFFRVQDLNMGDIIPGTLGGTVRLYPNGTRTATGTIVLVGNSHQPARFAGLGTQNEQVSILLAANTIQLTGPGAPMTLSLFEIGSTPTAILSTNASFFTIGSALGNFNFPVGASLAVGPSQAPGTYSGTFSITLNYL
jgi:Domain of unknown function (DUF4402)